MTTFIIYSDGAARGNPGPAGAGAVIKDTSGKLRDKVCEYLGETTNNQAEYQAFVLALEKAVKLNATEIIAHADSELLVKQINGIYRVKNKDLKPVYEKAKSLLRKIGRTSVKHIPREQNKEADLLANMAIDGQVL